MTNISNYFWVNLNGKLRNQICREATDQIRKKYPKAISETIGIILADPILGTISEQLNITAQK